MDKDDDDFDGCDGCDESKDGDVDDPLSSFWSLASIRYEHSSTWLRICKYS